MSKWSELHWSMLNLVATKLTHVNDHVAFSAVCSSWRSVALDIRPTFPCPLPHLMVRGENDDGCCISLSNNKLVFNQKLHIPLEDWYIGTSGGWLVTVHTNMDMSLYNPFSRERLPLPSNSTVPKLGEGEYAMENNIYVESAGLSSSNMNVNPKDMTVMIVQGGYRRLAFAKPGDLAWQIIDNDDCLYYSTVGFYKGMFYAVGRKGMVMCDIGLNPKVFLMVPRTMKGSPYELSRCYLIESQGGDLIMLERWVKYNDEDDSIDHLISHDIISDNDGTKNIDSTFDNTKAQIGDQGSDCLPNPSWTYMTHSFMAYKMDFAAKEWLPLEGIGDDEVFFVGFNSAFSLRVQTGEGNRVYFTDDYGEGQNSEIMDYGKLYTKDMGLYNFSNRTFSPHIDIGAALLFPPPM